MNLIIIIVMLHTVLIIMVVVIVMHATQTKLTTFGIAMQAEFVESGVRIEPKVLSQLKRALQPILKV